MIETSGYAAKVEVDGGIKADHTAEESVKAGATILVAGTAIYNREEPVSSAMGRLRGCVCGIRPFSEGHQSGLQSSAKCRSPETSGLRHSVLSYLNLLQF